MQLEQLAVTVRPRSGWQALDLGFQIARQWCRPIWLAWIAVYLPAALILHALLYDAVWLATLLLWWLKPVFDRAVMHVVSQAVFASPPTLRQTLRDARTWLKPGLLASLTLRRFDFTRSLMLPVVQLEQQRGREARERRKILGRRMRGYAVWLTVVCAHFEWIVFYSLGLLHLLLVPSGVETDFEWREILEAMAAAWGWIDAMLYVIAVSVIEPFYVCSGFSLYLNRRALLEGWDIELALRKLGTRLQRAVNAVALIVILFFGASMSPPATAAEISPQQAVTEVLKAPEFQEYSEEPRWVPRNKFHLEDVSDEPTWLANAVLFFSEISQGLAWVGAGLLIALLIYAALRRRVSRNESPAAHYVAPTALFGMDVRPEALPADIAATASGLAEAGRIREALSLLYRGALSSLIHRHRLRLLAGDTEEDCLRAAAKHLGQQALNYFVRLIGVWQRAAYARSMPAADDIQSLCREWTSHFAPAQAAT